MEPSRLVSMLVGLERDRDHGTSPGPGLCRAAMELLGMSGVAIMLRRADGPASSFGYTSDAVGELEDLQFTLGEGPGVDAHASGRAVFEPRLDDPVATRWSMFAPAAVGAGMLAAFGFPLRIGAVRLGALDLYHERPGSLTGDQVTDAAALAGVITQTLLAFQASASPGAVPREIDYVENLRAQVHQASGMLSEQLDIDILDALVRLRAHAYAEGRPVNDVAADVVARVLKIQ
jgi:GAF domain/ANTAR domain